MPVHPELLPELLKQITVKKCNSATLRLFQAENNAQLSGAAEKILAAQSLDVFREALIAIHEGRLEFETQVLLLNLCVNAADAMSNGGRLCFKSSNATHKVMRDRADAHKHRR